MLLAREVAIMSMVEMSGLFCKMLAVAEAAVVTGHPNAPLEGSLIDPVPVGGEQ